MICVFDLILQVLKWCDVFYSGDGGEAGEGNSSCFCRPQILSGEPLPTIMPAS